jgi:uncharacterized membrane protein
MSEILIAHCIIGPVLLAVSSMMKLWPPKKINSLYGYRTPRSMKSQRAWEEANSYSADLLLWAGISTLLVQVCCLVAIGGHASILIPLGYYLTFIIISIVLTERRLKLKGF